MTNSELLKKFIKDSGLKMTYIAQQMGISRAVLWRKINNLSSFDQYEIERICRIVGIKTSEDMIAVFFAQNVD